MRGPDTKIKDRPPVNYEFISDWVKRVNRLERVFETECSWQAPSSSVTKDKACHINSVSPSLQTCDLCLRLVNERSLSNHTFGLTARSLTRHRVTCSIHWWLTHYEQLIHKASFLSCQRLNRAQIEDPERKRSLIYKLLSEKPSLYSYL